MGQVGAPELILLAIIALIVLGPKRLPEVARSVGRGVREMRDALSGVGDEDDDDREKPTETELAERERQLEEREKALDEREAHSGE